MTTTLDRLDVWTAESVTEGHPDKVADAISDALLDAYLHLDPNMRVAAETFLPTAGLAVVGGEIGLPTGAAIQLEDVNAVTIVRDVIRRIGYTDPVVGFDSDHATIVVSLKSQSVEIAQGVVDADGAGDQGLIFGYACDETKELMPAPIMFAHRLAKQLAAVRRSGTVEHLRPDGKTQVTVQYRNDRPAAVTSIVLAAQHDPFWRNRQGDLKEVLAEHVVRPLIPPDLLEAFDWNRALIVNGTGAFEIGGPAGDAGLTGRKIIVDTYGGMAPHGGGAFSGKDATKVDRSANYYARYVAKHIVAAGLARRCLVRVAYAIGRTEPIGVAVKTFGTEIIAPERIAQLVEDCFDFRPASIVGELDLRRPIYAPFSAYGHFGREDITSATWEHTPKAEKLRQLAGKP